MQQAQQNSEKEAIISDATTTNRVIAKDPMTLNDTQAVDHIIPSSDNLNNKQIFQVRCPMDFTPHDVPSDGVYGIRRITRHPTFWSLGLLGLGTALTTPFAPEIVCFSAPALFAAIGGAHQDYRYR